MRSMSTMVQLRALLPLLLVVLMPSSCQADDNVPAPPKPTITDPYMPPSLSWDPVVEYKTPHAPGYDEKTNVYGNNNTNSLHMRSAFVMGCGKKFKVASMRKPNSLNHTNSDSPLLGEDVEVNVECIPMLNEVLIGTGQIVENYVTNKRKCNRFVVCNVTTGANECDDEKTHVYSHALFDQNKERLLSKKGVQEASGADKPTHFINLDPTCNAATEDAKLVHRYRRDAPPGIIDPHRYASGPDNEFLPYVNFLDSDYSDANQDHLGAKTSTLLVKDTKINQPCGANCDQGKVITYEPKEDNAATKISIYFTDECDWIIICTKAVGPKFECGHQKHVLKIFPRHGFVINLNHARAIPMKFFRSSAQKMSVIHIEKVKDTLEKDQQKGGRTVITGPFRQTTIGGYANTYRFSFGFSDKDKCLVKGLGINFPGAEGQVRVGGDKVQLVEDKRPMSLEAIALANTKAAEKTTPPFVWNEAQKATTTHKPVDLHQIGELGEEEIKNAGSYSAHTQRWGKSYWAIFLGFFCGSVGGLTFFGICMYLGRRSLYASWYRGMYKRYGTDASVMTGMTMVAAPGATVGPSATSADTTSSSTMGGTTMGGTTAGDVVTQ